MEEFGGSLENRTRFALSAMDKVRDMVGPDKVLEFRISADESKQTIMNIFFNHRSPSLLMICVSTQQPFPGETKVGILFGAIADLKRYLAKSGRWKGMMMQLVIYNRSVSVTIILGSEQKVAWPITYRRNIARLRFQYSIEVVTSRVHDSCKNTLSNH